MYYSDRKDKIYIQRTVILFSERFARSANRTFFDTRVIQDAPPVTTVEIKHALLL